MDYGEKVWTFAGSCGIGLCCKEGVYMQHRIETEKQQKKNQARLWFGVSGPGPRFADGLIEGGNGYGYD